MVSNQTEVDGVRIIVTWLEDGEYLDDMEGPCVVKTITQPNGQTEQQVTYPD